MCCSASLGLVFPGALSIQSAYQGRALILPVMLHPTFRFKVYIVSCFVENSLFLWDKDYHLSTSPPSILLLSEMHLEQDAQTRSMYDRIKRNWWQIRDSTVPAIGHTNVQCIAHTISRAALISCHMSHLAYVLIRRTNMVLKALSDGRRQADLTTP